MLDKIVKTLQTKQCPCGSLQKSDVCCLKTCCPICLTSPSYHGLRQKGWSLEKSLIRTTTSYHIPDCQVLNTFIPRTVVLCGNGSVGYFSRETNKPNGDDVWQVIQEAVHDFKSTPMGRGVGIPTLSGNCLNWMANVQKLVSYYNSEQPGSMPNEISEAVLHFREMLAEKLSQAKIRLRELECFGCNCGTKLPYQDLHSCGIITLNWDRAIEEFPHTIHLHGKINHSPCLVLPNQDFVSLQPKNGQLNQGFGASHAAQRWLGQCQNLLFWGCRFNDYDSILLTLITSATLRKQKDLNIFVCNPSKSILEEKLRDYFPLARFSKCIDEFKNIAL